MAFKAISLNDAAGKIEKVGAGDELILDGSQRIAQNLVVEGDLTVLGAMTEVATTQLKVKDPIIDLGMELDANEDLVVPTQAGASSLGFDLHYWDGAAAAVASIRFEVASGKWVFQPGLIVSDLEGNADTATALQTPRDFSITGEVVAPAIAFDGTGNVVLNATIPQGTVQLGGHTSGAYVESLAETSPYLSIVDASPAADGAQLTLSMAAASANTVDTLVARDASGDFSANHITAARFIGLADRATVLDTPRDFSMSGDVAATAISFDGSGNVALVSVIQPQAVEFGMMDPAAYRDSSEGIRPSASASDTEFATEKAIADALAAQSSSTTTLQAELDATQLQIGMVTNASATAGNGGYYLNALAIPSLGTPTNGAVYQALFSAADYSAGQTLVSSVEQVMSDVQFAADMFMQKDHELQVELDATQTGAGLGAGGAYTANGVANYIAAATSLKDADDKLDAAIKVNELAIAAEEARAIGEEARIEAKHDALQLEVDRLETATGMNQDGSFKSYSGTNYINAATSMVNADELLDTEIKQNADDIAAEITNRVNAITAIKFVGIGSSNQSAFAPLVLTMEDLDASLTDADLRLSANHGKRLGFAVKGKALSDNYMVIDANGTSKDFEWSLSIEDNHANFPLSGAGSHGTFASTQAIVDYVAQEVSNLQTQITASSQWDYSVNGTTGTLDFANGETLSLNSSPSIAISVDPLSDTIDFDLGQTIQVAQDMEYGRELIQLVAAPGAGVSQYGLLKADFNVCSDNSERCVAISAGVYAAGALYPGSPVMQKVYVDGQIIDNPSWVAPVGTAMFLGATGGVSANPPALIDGHELVEIGVMTPAGLRVSIKHIMTY